VSVIDDAASRYVESSELLFCEAHRSEVTAIVLSNERIASRELGWPHDHD
jgi:hypothetical protein